MMDAHFINYMSEPLIEAVQVILIALVCLSIFELTPDAFKQAIRRSFASITHESDKDDVAHPDIFVSHKDLRQPNDHQLIPASLNIYPYCEAAEATLFSGGPDVRFMQSSKGNAHPLVSALNTRAIKVQAPRVWTKSALANGRVLSIEDMLGSLETEEERYALMRFVNRLRTKLGQPLPLMARVDPDIIDTADLRATAWLTRHGFGDHLLV